MKNPIRAIALIALIGGVSGYLNDKDKVAATADCNPHKMADTFRKGCSADGARMQASAEALQHGQTEACGEKAGHLMADNPVKYQAVLQAFAKHEACMNDVFQCN